jgi:hypothetical protein
MVRQSRSRFPGAERKGAGPEQAQGLSPPQPALPHEGSLTTSPRRPRRPRKCLLRCFVRQSRLAGQNPSPGGTGESWAPVLSPFVETGRMTLLTRCQAEAVAPGEQRFRKRDVPEVAGLKCLARASRGALPLGRGAGRRPAPLPRRGAHPGAAGRPAEDGLEVGPAPPGCRRPAGGRRAGHRHRLRLHPRTVVRGGLRPRPCRRGAAAEGRAVAGRGGGGPRPKTPSTTAASPRANCSGAPAT